MTKPRVVLIGLPGAGKSAVGARLARRLHLAFADTDRLISTRTGRSVAELFATVGETGFRELEAEVIAAALIEFPGVLALGGGAVTTESVRTALADSGVDVLLLTADLPELVERVSRSDHRPLLAGDAVARLAELSEQRDALYRSVATLTVDTSGRSVADVSADIAAQLIGQHA